ncbi:hypothetical protein DM860_011264 [Cuscuta australis]|uniref:CRIB domain-containing protein n=1 Tax=Cuscuta australis TaxID=267555 RepID=A0A328DQ04_9ASTE|nr:hypothetical protein DM860_011264 [Cuscuta australis]
MRGANNRVERFRILPFSMGCASLSSVAVAHPHHKPNRVLQEWMEEDNRKEIREEEEDGEEKIISVPKLQRLLKNLSQLLSSKEEEEEEEEERMEIGHPTDVKHVAHVGLEDETTGSILVDPIVCPNTMMMMDMHHHHHGIFFTTEPSFPSPRSTPMMNPPSPTAFAYDIHCSSSS